MEYKRLTKLSDLGTLHALDFNGEEQPLCELTALDIDVLIRRLYELENKIESGELCEREESEWKHRAEVAEDELARHKRALRIAGDKFINEVCNMRGEDISDKCDYKCDTCFYDYYLQQAEKELAEEGKNGTMDYTDR